MVTNDLDSLLNALYVQIDDHVVPFLGALYPAPEGTLRVTALFGASGGRGSEESGLAYTLVPEPGIHESAHSRSLRAFA